MIAIASLETRIEVRADREVFVARLRISRVDTSQTPKISSVFSVCMGVGSYSLITEKSTISLKALI